MSDFLQTWEEGKTWRRSGLILLHRITASSATIFQAHNHVFVSLHLNTPAN